MSDLTGTMFDATTGKPLGTVEKSISFDTLMVKTAEEPEIETVRELKLSYRESLGDARKSLEIDTYATFRELRKLCRLLLGEVR